MRRLLVPILAVLSAACARKNITGTVQDNFHRPLANAQVRVQGTGFSATTDAQGRFSVAYAPGSFTLEAGAERHIPFSRTLSITERVAYPIGTIELVRRAPGDGLRVQGPSEYELVAPVALGENRRVVQRTWGATCLDRIVPGSVPALTGTTFRAFLPRAPRNNWAILRASRGVVASIASGLMSECPPVVRAEGRWGEHDDLVSFEATLTPGVYCAAELNGPAPFHTIGPSAACFRWNFDLSAEFDEVLRPTFDPNRAIWLIRGRLQADTLPTGNERLRVIDRLAQIATYRLRDHEDSTSTLAASGSAFAALERLRAREAAAQISRWMIARAPEIDDRQLQSAMHTLGALGDVAGTEGLVLALALAQNGAMYPHAKRALAALGRAHAVPALVQMFQGHNPHVAAIAARGASSNLPSNAQTAAADMLCAFGVTDMLDAMLAAAADPSTPTFRRDVLTRGLAELALANPSVRARIVAALEATIHTANQRVEDIDRFGWLVRHLVLAGAPSSVSVIAESVRVLAPVERQASRVLMLVPLAHAARRSDLVAVRALIEQTRRELLAQDQTDGSAQSLLDRMRDTEPLLALVERCADGDVPCLLAAMTDGNGTVAEKAARLLVWTTPEPARASTVRTLVERLRTVNDWAVRVAILRAIEGLTSSPVPEAVSLVEEALRTTVEDSRFFYSSPFEAVFWLARMRARTSAPSPRSAS